MKYNIVTYGCQMNENDSEKLSGIIEKLGYEKTLSLEECDLIILNTCSVRENANDKFFGKLGVLKKLKEKKPSLIIGVCGCMMQEEHLVKAVKEKFKFVDLIFGTHNIANFPKLLEEVLSNKKTVVEVLRDEEKIDEGLPIKRALSYRGLVTIMNGCDNFCSYCIVPYTRGREKSRPSENIIEEVKLLAKNNVSEIMLLGQNVNSYGKGLEGDINFAELLKRVSDIDGIKRVRFMTNHPKDLNTDVIKAIKERENICNHIHLPLQSGSSRILKLMNRKYTKEAYLDLVSLIRSEIEDIAITTDIIVGFPTETEEDFLETLDVMKKAKFDLAYTYIYSKREGTKAAVMEGQVDPMVIKERFPRLLKLHDDIAYEQNKPYLNKTVEVLVEGKSKSNKDILTGRTLTNKLVNFKGKAKEGEYVNVKIDEVKSFYIAGSIV